jgi:hypothetical protein
MTVGELLLRSGTVIAFVAYDYQCEFVCSCEQGQKLLMVGSLTAINGRVTLKAEEISPLALDTRDMPPLKLSPERQPIFPMPQNRGQNR